jgi:hypothetical protein
MMVGALAGPVSFRMQCLYHDSYCAAILVIDRKVVGLAPWGTLPAGGWPNLGSQFP